MSAAEFPYPDLDDLDNDSPRQPSLSTKRPPKPWLSLRVMIGAFIVLVILGTSGYWYTKHRHSTAKPPTAPHATTPQPAPATSSTTAHYASSEPNLNLSFNYPSTWTVSPTTTTAAGTQPITVTSPLLAITGTSGTSVTGKIIINIRPDSSTASELSANTATAAQNGLQYAYAQPAADQHQYFYVAFVHLTGGANPTGGFEEVIITGITNFAQGQAVTTGSLSNVVPLISANFYACSTKVCSGSSATPLSITTNTWNNATVFVQVQSIFASLQLN